MKEGLLSVLPPPTALREAWWGSAFDFRVEGSVFRDQGLGFRVSLSKSFVHAASLREVGLLPLTRAASLCPPSSHPAYISFRV